VLRVLLALTGTRGSFSTLEIGSVGFEVAVFHFSRVAVNVSCNHSFLSELC
jgi:hypothetical protein